MAFQAAAPKAPQEEGQAPPFGMLHSFHKEVSQLEICSFDVIYCDLLCDWLGCLCLFMIVCVFRCGCFSQVDCSIMFMRSEKFRTT